jgi:hypothetical protein
MVFIASKLCMKRCLFQNNHNFNKKLLYMVKVEDIIVSKTLTFCLCNISSNKGEI